MKYISLGLEKTLWTTLMAIGKDKGLSLTSLVRMVLTEYSKGEEVKRTCQNAT